MVNYVYYLVCLYFGIQLNVSCSFVFVLRVCERHNPQSDFIARLMTLTLAMPQSLRSINEVIRASVAEFIGSLADKLTQVIKYRLSGFTKRFSEEIAKITRQSSKPLKMLIRPAAKFQL